MADAGTGRETSAGDKPQSSRGEMMRLKVG